MKKIVLFSDGTGNSAASPHKTNVWRAYQALDKSGTSGQIAYYDNGVGTSSFKPTTILGLAFGWGLARNVKEIYRFLCRTYNPGDEIYCFGFSRGAFTIRVVTALICNQGIVNRNEVADEQDFNRRISTAYHRYRQDSFTPSFLSFFLRPLRDAILNRWYTIKSYKPYKPEQNIRYRDEEGDPPLVKFVGVWDTVDAYGGPIDELTRAWDKVIWPLTAKDRDLSPRVGRACHALALDEQRESFEPMVWNEDGAALTERLDQERISQVWFPGVHANVGGGYPDDKLANISLNWILDEAEKNDGLTFFDHERRRYAAQSDAVGPLYDSRAGLGMFYRYAPRRLGRICHEQKPGLSNWLKGKFSRPDAVKNEVNIETPKLHQSIFDRIQQGGDAYAPINVPVRYGLVDHKGLVIDSGNPGSHAPAMPESETKAQERRGRQSYVWNKVWGRKMVYFVTLALLLWFLIYPYFPAFEGDGEKEDLIAFLETVFGTFSYVIQGIPELVGKLPGLGAVEAWTGKYAQFPFVFASFAVLIGALLLLSVRIHAQIKYEMRRNWYHVSGRGIPPSDNVSGFRKTLAAFLENPNYEFKIARTIRIAVESLAVIFFFVLLVAVCSRVVYVTADGAGLLCQDEPHVADAELGKEFKFDPSQACFNTGIPLQKGEVYEIAFGISSDWSDASIEADVRGWTSAPWYMHLLTPFRRSLLVDWYQPIARVDNRLFDRHPLRISDSDILEAETVERLLVKFEARRSGSLYLYLNDGVFFSPGVILSIYENNRGYACAKVREATAREDEELVLEMICDQNAKDS